MNCYLFINSRGGWVIPGVAIYDTMQFVRFQTQLREIKWTVIYNLKSKP